MKEKICGRRLAFVMCAAAAVFLVAIIFLTFCQPSGNFSEQPLEPGQLFRFRRETVESLTLRHTENSHNTSRELCDREELEQALNCLESFRYDTTVTYEPLSGENGGYSFLLQTSSSGGRPAASPPFFFDESSICWGNIRYSGKEGSLTPLTELF